MHTSEAIERKASLEKYFTAQINLGEGKWLIFDRQVRYDGFESDAIELKVIDEEMQTTSLLGTFFHGRWSSPNAHNGNELWKILKVHDTAVIRVLNKLSTPLSDFKPFVFEWRCFKRRFRLQSIKIKRKLKNR